MEVLRALAALSEPPSAESRRLADLLELGEPATEAQWSDLFLFRLYPYASVYLGADGHIGGEARDRVAGLWRALGLAPPAECDHLAVMLSFYAEVAEREAAAAADARRRWRHVRRVFLCEHLVTWLPVFLAKLDVVAPPFYRRWGALLAAALGRDAAGLPRPRETPLHWRDAPRLADPRRDGAGAFLGALLTPAASGLVLVRDDLERAARRLDLALRLGERRFLLETLLDQAPGPFLGWLGDECRAQRRRLAARRADELEAGGFWLDRLTATAALLDELGADAG